MKIAIHHRPGSFSDGWINYCTEQGIEYKIVNAYDNDIVQQIDGCDVFMWHHHHADYKDVLSSKTILFAIEQAGIKVFPDFHTGWHFDNKVAQKYVLEAIRAPLIKSYVFYEKEKALNWSKVTSYPKVFKLKGGAGASNVRLVRNKSQCQRLINKAFNRGFSQFNRWGYLKERWRQFKGGKVNSVGMLKAILKLFFATEFSKMYAREKGYIYFQDFIPGNDGDIRLIVIGQKYAYGMKRMNRKNDFRASGSSDFVYDEIPEDTLKVAFSVAKRLELQTVAFDFIKDENDSPLIVEISYGFGTVGSSQCAGYWTEDLVWHKESFNPFKWMIDFVDSR